MAASQDCISSSRDHRALRRKKVQIEEVDISAESILLLFVKLATARYAFRSRRTAFVAHKQPPIWEITVCSHAHALILGVSTFSNPSIAN
jgi:hypothetical protein